ncbi:MAG: DUF3466 family protein [Betaproteobacteria bacterium]|nr:DUF3466 family protein [Betaproteobacteria bacterium]
MIDVGVLGNCESTAHGLNNRGQVVGDSADPNFRTYAFATGPNGAGIRNLGTPGAVFGNPVSSARGINDYGTIVGNLGNGDGVFVSSPNGTGGPLVRITPPAGTGGIYAWAINASGQIAGQFQPTYGTNPVNAPFHAFVTAPGGGAFTDVGAFPSLFNDNETYGRAVNATGQIAGGASGFCNKQTANGYFCGSFSTKASSGDLYSLGVLGAETPFSRGNSQSFALGINDKGRIVGYSDTVNGGPSHAYVSDGTTLTDLETFGGTSSRANAINNAGQVVGQYTLNSGARRAFLWDDASGMVDLNTRIDASSGWTLTEAVAINDKGQIAANASHPRFPNCSHAVLLSCKDTDGDALCDDWERNGITVQTASGPAFLNLPAMGADPLHKDIFVHVDYLVEASGFSHNLTLAAQKLLIDAFAAQDIRLHIDCGWNCIMNPVTGDKWSTAGDTMSKSASIVETAQLAALDEGTVFQVTAPFMEANFANARGNGKAQERAQVFHYAFLGHGMKKRSDCGNEDTSSGLSPVPGSNFVVTLGLKPEDASGLYDFALAGTFMHELGHNLGLHHGGPLLASASDRTLLFTGKPNHFSVMNYSWQIALWRKVSPDTFAPFIDYSRHANPTLDEAALEERHGIRGAADVDPLLVMYFCEGSDEAVLVRSGANNPIDWNCSALPLTSDGIDLVPVRANVNHDYEDCARARPRMSPLTNYGEWTNLHFRGGNIGSASGVPTMQVDVSGLPSEQSSAQLKKQLFRMAQRQADLDHNGKVDLDDVAVLQRALNRPAAGTDPRDLNHDGRIDALDARLLTTLCTKPRCSR